MQNEVQTLWHKAETPLWRYTLRKINIKFGVGDDVGKTNVIKRWSIGVIAGTNGPAINRCLLTRVFPVSLRVYFC